MLKITSINTAFLIINVCALIWYLENVKVEFQGRKFCVYVCESVFLSVSCVDVLNQLISENTVSPQINWD